MIAVGVAFAVAFLLSFPKGICFFSYFLLPFSA